MSSDSNTDYRVLLRDAALEIRSLRDKLETVEKAQKEPLAIIGMGCRFPGKANDPESLWRLLCDGVDAVTEVPANRWNADVFYDPDPMTPGKANTRWGGFLEEIDLFDPYFFGISPREAAYMDPQQRLLLEVAWEALEDAGQVLDSLRGSQTGVFVGIYNSDYSWLQLATPNHIDVYSAAGSGHSIAANRLSYLLDLHGPSVAIDTACSSSLLAIHMACQSLRHRECDLALAGGVNLILSPLSMIATSKVLSMASDGRCKTFDARADGLVRGEGCGMVALKRLSDARADGDPILALIRGSAANQDGRSAGLTAPNMLAQQRVIQQALENAKVKPEQVSYIESHGTGTTLGDPIEIDALKAAFGQFSNGRRCLIGALKTNIGHLEAAAGVAGLIKAVLVLKHEAVPPNLHFRTLNPNISFENTPFAIPTQVSPWPSGAEPRYAGVNSFGAGGTNVHVVLEEAPAFPAADEDDVLPPSQAHLLLLSAQGEKPLLALAEAYQQFLATEQAGKEVPLRNLCYTASVRRSHHKQRLALVGHSPREFAGKLDEFLQDGTCSGMSVGKAWNQRRGLVFVFSGQGAQWPGMGQELLAREQVFRQVIEQCDVLLRQYGDLSLLQEISAGKEQSRLGQTAIVQPVTFALQVALAALWRSWGVVPDAVVGHSVGEVAAAHVAGVLSLEDAMRVAFHRGQLMEQAAGRGKMAVVGLPVEQAQAAIGGYEDRLSIAAINSPKATVLSGEAATLEKVLQSLDTHIFRRMLRLDYAFHSHQMEAIQPALVEALQEIEPRPAAIPIFSTLTGQLSNGRGFDAAYWGRQVRKPVLFAAAINQLTEDQNAVFVEISSHPVLSANISECLHYRDQAGSVLPSLRRDNEEQAMMLSTLGALYTLGYPLDWKRLYPSGRCIRLPSYPWQRERLWLEAEPLHHQLQITASEPPGQLHETGHQPQGERREEGLTTAVLLSIEPEKRRQVLENYLCRRLSEVLNIPVSRIDVNEPLTGMGIDSLMGVQLKNKVEASFGVDVPLVNFFQGLGVAQLAALLLEQMCEGENAPSTPPDFTASSLGVCPDVGAEMTQEKAKRVLEKVDQLTEAEIDAMLGRLGAEPAASVDGPRPGGTESALRRVPGSITGSALVGLKLPALVGKTAIITGSSQGIGRAIAIALGRMGANVVVNYYSNQASAKETAEAIETGGGKAIVVRANVEDKGQIERLVATGAEHFGSVDIFIGNAASGVPRPLLEQDDRVWDWTMNVNARSIFIGVKAAIPYMKARGWGRVIGITSLGSRRVLPNYGVIGVSKAAIEALIRYFAVELAPHGICCNTISPGLIVTNSVKHFPSWEQFAENTRDRTPTGALVTFEQTAAMVAFLCSESASSIVGQTLVIDGGYEVAS